METERIRTRNVIITIISLSLFFFLLGYFVGTYATLKIVANLAAEFIEVDEELIELALSKYRAHLGYYIENEILQIVPS